MNIIYTLPCGCHRGLRECEEALQLRAAMKAARDQIEQSPMFSGEQWAAYALWMRCHNAYLAHFKQGRESVEVPI